ncbi:MAG TPA: pyruvate kinase [Nitrososphaerales archaeon]|nr:pyruvate kinase [Nitrososphaerales archaeon]
MRKTKIVCTIGPASDNSRVVRRLLSHVDVFRINFSHGDETSHLKEMRTIRAESRRAGKTVAILQDLPGPKIRVGKMRERAAELAKGSRFVLTSKDVLGDSKRASVNRPDLLESVDRGDLLYLADGLIKLRVEQKTEDGVECIVLAGGVLSSGKGVNAPGVRMKVNYPTPQDVAHLRFGLSHAVDFVAASFVRTPEDVRAIRRLIGSKPRFLIAKIEKREAVENFDAILDEADGIMVARGDLGIETPIQRVPLIQKEIVRKCNAAGKPVIVATQMLISMVNSPVPSRAEVTDVSTAILDGTDAVMLSDETAVGRYPVESARMLDRIARSTEKILRPPPQSGERPGAVVSEEAIGRAACSLADYVGAKAIVAPTQSGLTAKRVAKFRPRQPIVALCTEPRVARMLKLYNGVIPVVSKPAKTMDWLFKRADLAAAELGLAKKGERIVVTCGTPGMKGSTNLIKLSVVGTPA